MELRYIETPAQWDFCKDLYHSAFNDNERRPWSKEVDLQSCDKRFALYTIESMGDMLGFISLWHFDTFTYVEHFAVWPLCRGGGIGAQTMQELGSIAGQRVVLEVEPPIEDIDKRRVGFYQRQGFAFIDKPYIQPAYAADKKALPMNIMTRGEFDIEREFDTIVETLHTQVYGIKS